MIISNKRTTLLNMLIWFTLLAVCAQTSFFILHYKVSNLVDSLVESSLVTQMWHTAIILPILGFFLIQIISYVLYVAWIWFIAVNCGETFKLSTEKTYWLGILTWVAGICAITTFNNYYFTDSFFALLFHSQSWYNEHTNTVLLILCTILLSLLTLNAYINFFLKNRHRVLGTFFLAFIVISFVLSVYNNYFAHSTSYTTTTSKPNIIFIGLDSLRPDYTNFFGSQIVKTPNINSFMQGSTVFTNAYTPLARTFPAWMSILTSKYPKNSYARTNLADPSMIIPNDNIAKKLKAAGYQTIYGTDEKRFSNITNSYGFDNIIGPSMGVNDFLLGGLSDFPLTNLLINTPIGEFLFPYNYGNRAAAITYEPDSFLKLVKLTLAHRQNKPLFLAVHLCVSHWPFTWAHDKQKSDFALDDRYASSVNEVDKQLGELLAILKNDGLLNNTLVVLLSDHGTTLGLPNDRMISEANYIGELEGLHWLPRFKIIESRHVSPKQSGKFSLNTSYGQGTDILSLKQYHVLMAFRGYGIHIDKQLIGETTSLIDISPTVLDFLNIPNMQNIDGISLNAFLQNNNKKNGLTKKLAARPLMLETGFSVAGIETSNISVSNVVKQGINMYQINPKNGLLFVSYATDHSINKNKQRGVMFGDWLLASYPLSTKSKLVRKPNSNEMIFEPVVIPSYLVLMNTKTGEWSIGPANELANKAPMNILLKRLTDFYGDELK